MVVDKTRELVIVETSNAHSVKGKTPTLQEHLSLLHGILNKVVPSNKKHSYDEFYLKGHEAGDRSWVNIVEQDDEPQSYGPTLIGNKNFVQGFLDYTEIKKRVVSVNYTENDKMMLERMISRVKLEVNPKTKSR